MSSTLSNAASAAGTAFAAAIAALSPTQLAALFTSSSTETTQEKRAMSLLNLYITNMQMNNAAGESSIQASLVTISPLPDWFVDSLPGIWGASTVAEAQKAVAALQVKLDGAN